MATAPTVQTVLGPVDAGDLGRVLVHEHVRISYPGDHLDPSYGWDRRACVATAVERMHQLQQHGVRTFVDPCPIELGRDPELMAEVAQASGMHVVCSTGFYTGHDGVGLPYYWRQRTAEEIAEFYLHEIEHGIGDTGIRPGVIKVATGAPPTDVERPFVRGAAMAARESGLGIVTHCEHAQGGDVQQEILADEGVDLSRCVIGHQDQAADPAQVVAIAERGSIVGIDRVGYTLLAPDAQRVELVAALLAAGHAERLALSQDHMCCLASPKWPYPYADLVAPHLDEIYEQMHRRPHTYLFTDFLPLLRERGVDDATLDTVLVANPRRLLAG